MNRIKYHYHITALVAFSALASSLTAGETVIDTFDDISGWKVQQPGRYRGAKGFKAKVEKAESAAVGTGAIKVTLPGMVHKKLWKRYPPLANIAWNKFQGVSFRVKGDGSGQYGCIALCGNSYRSWGYSYVYFFPLKNTEWHTVTVPWHDFIPESDKLPIAARGSLPPSGIMHIRFGDRWTIGQNNYPIPPHSYCIDQLVLVEKIPCNMQVPAIRPLADAARLLKDKKPITILCMGDSITAGTGLADREHTRYAVQIQKLLRKWFGYDRITVVSHAVGGARMVNARAWLNRDFDGIQPDLVTTLYGYNEKSGGTSVWYFKVSMNDYLDRIARKTGGRAAIMPMTTIPGLRHRYSMMDDYADAVREVAGARGLTCLDLQQIMKTNFNRTTIEPYFHDMAHPNEKGHLFMATQIARFIAKAAGKNDAELKVPAGMLPAPEKRK